MMKNLQIELKKFHVGNEQFLKSREEYKQLIKSLSDNSNLETMKRTIYEEIRGEM